MKKVTLDTLKNIGSPSNEWPDFLSIETSEDHLSISIQCLIPQDLKWFEGHYPEQPVLPGVVQVNWASELAQALFSTDTTHEFKGINSLKFNTMILPNTTLSLNLKNNTATGSISFNYSNESDRFSSGKIILETSSDTLLGEQS